MRLRTLGTVSLIACACSAMSTGSLVAQLVNDGAPIVIEEGALVHVSGAVDNTAGTFNLAGALIVEGDLSNSGTFNAGETGELMFTGSGTSTLSGLSSPVAVFTVAGPGSVVLGSPLWVGGELWLDGGIINLGAFNLTLSPGASIQGNPSAASMVATTGTGNLLIPVTGLGEYFFPVGTLSGGPAYTPIWIDLLDADFDSSAYIMARVEPESGSINPSLNNFVNRAWFLSGSSGLVLRDASATFAWDQRDEVGEVGNLFGGLFADSQLFLLESVDPLNRQFTARVGRLGAFTAGEERAFDDEILAGGEPPSLQLPPSLSSEGGSVDLAGAYQNLPGMSFALGPVSFPGLFTRLEIVNGRLEVRIAEGAVGESSVVIRVTNEYGVTSEQTVYITEQPDPRLVRSELNELTGYFEQDFVLENISAVRPLDIVDVIIAQLPTTATVARASLIGVGKAVSFTRDADATRIHAERLLMPGQSLTLRIEYISRTRLAADTIAVGYGDYGIFADSMVDRGWLRLRPFGWFHPTDGRWSYHHGLGWVYPIGNDVTNLPLWRHDHGWLWSSDTYFPNFYDYGTGSWLYYLPGSYAPAWFYDYTTGDWFRR